ncbi:hypothetical protein JCM19046_4134 [Bacillus sp. JCM 19046]|nr:hypothetical protein JCM19045_3492 [Bacillus sp. JCM 19045]GAF19481.1 hypothetical protein JCM19046_4134 [Bacillus sp. JCM 19046]
MLDVLILMALLIVLAILGAPVFNIGKMLVKRMLIGSIVLSLFVLCLLIYDLLRLHLFT